MDVETSQLREAVDLSPYRLFSREEWANLRAKHRYRSPLPSG